MGKKVHINFFLKAYIRAIKSYGELWRAMERNGLNIFITLLFAPSRALKSYGKLRRATASHG